MYDLLPGIDPQGSGFFHVDAGRGVRRGAVHHWWHAKRIERASCAADRIRVSGTLAAATTLCKRVLDEYKANDAAGQPDKPLVRPWLFAVSHMLGSWLAGAGFFLVGMSQGVNVWMLLAMVLVAS